jgi:hypothetical protein
VEGLEKSFPFFNILRELTALWNIEIFIRGAGLIFNYLKKNSLKYE